MKSKRFLPIFVILLAVLAYFGYSLAKKRYFSSSPQTVLDKDAKENKNNKEAESQASLQGGLKEEITSDSIKITIGPSDCDNECSKFKKEAELEYCRQVCGIETYYDYSESDDEGQDESSDENGNDSNDSSGDCDDEKGLEKDYCLKDNAIDEGNFRMCDLISDAGIKKTCQNRITEDLLEQQQNQSEQSL
jgi:hypothetical protein